MNKILPDKQKATLVYTSTKLGSNFNIKDITKKEHNHNLVYSVKCLEETCNETYSGETGRRLVERIDEHRAKDKNSHVYQHSVNSNHALVTLDDFTILNSGYKHNKFKRKISEALFIKSNRPNLNKQDTSVPLKLFNWDFIAFKFKFFFVFFFYINFPKSNNIWQLSFTLL